MLESLMPPEASSWASSVDWINGLITYISLFCIVGVNAVMIYFAVRYRRRSPNDVTPSITHNTALETVWTVVPTIIVIYIFYYGFVTYREMRNPPAGSLEVMVTGRKWSWEFEQPNGKKSTSELVVPIGKPVRLIMKSQDVLHSFFIPAMRVKEDVRGDNYSYLWFTPTLLGEFQVFCAEYCGLNHSGMRAKLRVVSEEEYQDYLVDRQGADAVEIPPAQLGEKIYNSRGCNGCHTLNGTPGVGPSFKGFFARQSRALSDGTSAPVDENFVRESLQNPNAKVAAGFQPNLMPSFQGQLSDKEIAGVIAFLKTL